MTGHVDRGHVGADQESNDLERLIDLLIRSGVRDDEIQEALDLHAMWAKEREEEIEAITEEYGLDDEDERGDLKN